MYGDQIDNPASDFPLAVIDWRSTKPEDFITVDVMFPKCKEDDPRLPDTLTYGSIEGYEARDEAMAVAFRHRHQFFYLKDMRPEEVMLLKCYDSFGEGQPSAVEGIAVWAPHTAFVDPQTPESAPGRHSIEVRGLVYYQKESK